jgi:hypothetical protein
VNTKRYAPYGKAHMTATSANLQAFVTFCKGLRGDEKSESQTFLDRFFRAFGHEGAIEAGAEFEDRLKKGSAKGNMGFADLVWRSRQGVPGVLIEMKKRGEDLSKHYAQVERYWMRITPNRPRYAMLCNFDEFWIFDFENQVDEPVDKISTEQLPERAGALTFMEIGGNASSFPKQSGGGHRSLGAAFGATVSTDLSTWQKA